MAWLSPGRALQGAKFHNGACFRPSLASEAARGVVKKEAAEARDPMLGSLQGLEPEILDGAADSSTWYQCKHPTPSLLAFAYVPIAWKAQFFSPGLNPGLNPGEPKLRQLEQILFGSLSVHWWWYPGWLLHGLFRWALGLIHLWVPRA